MSGGAFHFADKGSRVLREFMAQRAIEKAMKKRNGRSGFAGASIDRLTASLSSWSGSVNSDLDGTLTTLRARSRNLCANTEYGRRFLTLVAGNVIGPEGPSLQVRLDGNIKEAVEAAFYKWSCECDITGRMSLVELQRVGIKAVARDGDTIINLVRAPDLRDGIAVQVLECDRVNADINGTGFAGMPAANVARLGVELDTRGRHTAYYMMEAHPGEDVAARKSRVTTRHPAKDTRLVFLHERAEQVRGYPWMHAVMQRAQMLSGYEEAAVVAARLGASKMGFFKRSADAVPGGLDAMGENQSDGSVTMSARPGEFEELPYGYELQQWDPQYPHEQFGEFVRSCLRGISAGLDVDYPTFANDLSNVNYSSIRAGTIETRDQWIALQGWWIRSCLNWIYREWLASALLQGSILNPQTGKPIPAARFKEILEASEFQGRRWDWVDPLKDAQASQLLIDQMLTSRTRVAASRGLDFADIVREQEIEKKMLDDAGLSIPEPKNSAPQPDQPPDNTGA